jgi:hypothetical protein
MTRSAVLSTETTAEEDTTDCSLTTKSAQVVEQTASAACGSTKMTTAESDQTALRSSATDSMEKPEVNSEASLLIAEGFDDMAADLKR